jgi:hypothetical protein
VPGAELGYVFALTNRSTGEQVCFPHCEQCLSGLDEDLTIGEVNIALKLQDLERRIFELESARLG